LPTRAAYGRRALRRDEPGQRGQLAVEALGLLQVRGVTDAFVPGGLGDRLEAAAIAHRLIPPDAGR
jgi:hypothetical protein